VPIVSVASGGSLNIVVLDETGGEASLTWQGWTYSEPEDWIIHRFVGTHTLPDIPVRMIVSVETSFVADIGFEDDVPDDVPVLVQIDNKVTPVEFSFDVDTEDTNLPQSYVMTHGTVRNGDRGFQVFAIHRGTPRIVRSSGMVIGALHVLMEAEGSWRPAGPWIPADEGEVTELSETTSVTGSMDTNLSFTGESGISLHSFDLPSLMWHESALDGIRKDDPRLVR
jgi:hypothetical protein